MAETWLTVQPSLDALTAPVEPILDATDSALSAIIAILNIVQSLLDVMKAFAVGYTDPLRATIEALLAEIQSVISDFRQLGVYLTGDWGLITPENNYADLLGGYQAYERRMLGRLLDQEDPNRPNFTSSTTVLGVFFHASSNDIAEVVKAVTSISNFFGQRHLEKRVRPYGAPCTPKLTYGMTSAGLPSFRRLGQLSTDTTPDSLSVTWTMPSSAGGMSNVFSPAPKGFLIHVSTVEDGLTVVGRIPKDLESSSSEPGQVATIVLGAIDPNTNLPLKLYGGIADIAANDADSTDFSEVEPSDERAPALLLQLDQNTPLIRPSLLKNGATPLLATTFFVKNTGPLRGGPGAEYSVVLPRSLLPQHASFSRAGDGFAQIDGGRTDSNTFWVRVRALNSDYVDAVGLDSAKLLFPSPIYGKTEARPYRFSTGLLRQARSGILIPEPPGTRGVSLSSSSLTQASGPATIAFPSPVQRSYIEAVQAAILVAVLCRADLTESSTKTFHTNVCAPGQGLHGLEGAGRDLMARFGLSPLWFKQMRPSLFRQKLLWLMARVASDLQEKGAPPDLVAEAIVNSAGPMLSFTWADVGGSPEFQPLSLLESIDSTVVLAGTTFPNSEQMGVGANPYCRSEHKKVVDGWYSRGSGPKRSPAFMVRDEDLEAADIWVSGGGSADYSPIVYCDPTGEVTSAGMRVEFIRNTLMAHNDGEVIKSAAQVLQLAGAMVSRPLSDAQWLSVRLMPQGLLPLDQLLEQLSGFMSGVLNGTDDMSNKIVAYIETIQARIYQLQALLEQVRALRRALEFYTIPPVSALVLVESGTDGLISSLISSENKPSTSAADYSGGVLVVSGGLPTALLDILAAVLGKE